MVGLITFLLFLFSVAEITNSTTVDAINRLNEDLLRNYKKNIRPPFDNSQTLKVRTVILLMSVLDYDDVSGILRVIAGATISWNDYRLIWNPLINDNITDFMVLRDLIWFPDVIVTNPAVEAKPLTSVERVRVRVYPDGEIVYTLADKISVMCESDMTYFPFDTQTCDITFIPWLYYRREVYLVNEGSKVNLEFYVNNSVWDLFSNKVEETGRGMYGGVKAQITLKRRPLYFCINMLMPVLILAILNPLVFVLPPESGERISFSVTIFLSFAVFMTVIGDQLPKSSTSISRTSCFLWAVVSYSAVIIMAAIINLWIYHKEASQRNVFKWNQKNFLCKDVDCGTCQSGNSLKYRTEKSGTGCSRDMTKTVDYVAFIVSYLFLIFVVVAFSLSVI
ncbi:hypothetical protein FSP39_014396 [Pinctada imbricata]|uniref:Uncharacterized protein n=1 Tax=Pinctada imbricata TaxID=66713 RepID=A0AA88XNM9_PINIB|nr:hypothetical protein FSP39_014396 [Pinctada imbricata]